GLYGQPAWPLVSPPVYELRHPARDRLWSVGEQRPDLPDVRDIKQPGHCASSGRLGPGGRARMALLASPDVGIRGRALLRKRRTTARRMRTQRTPTNAGSAIFATRTAHR